VPADPREGEGGAPPPSLPERLIAPLAGLGTALAAALVLLTLAVTGYSVVLRYVFGTPVTWTDELSGYLVIGIVMLGAARCLLRGEHINVDLLSGRARGRGRLALQIWAVVAVGLLVAALGYSAVRMLRFSIDFGMYSEGYLGTPMWIPQAVLFGGVVLLGLAVLARIATLLAALRQP
jgi:TRAP-type C4-dicarboxylate transport system permease small subunit